MVLARAPKALFTSLAIVAVLFLLVGCGKDSLVNPKIGPTADFSADPVTGDRPLDVTFTDLSTPGSSRITAWFWNFGDGTTSTLQSVGHLYGAAGVYNVSLRVTTDDGTDTKVRQDYITVTKAGLLPPNAAFTAAPTTGPPGTVVQFSDQSSTGSALNITGWFWDFGDSTGTSTARNPAHTYAKTGTYDVTLSVTTSVGTDTETKTGFVTIAPTKPIANFAASPTSGQAPLAVNFTDQSLDGGSPITAWAWTFGDGASSTTPSPSHTYAAAGTYTVSLTTTNAIGSSSVTKANFIAVSAQPVGPTAGFIGAPTSGTAPLMVQFTDQSLAGTSAITAWSWDFGDGSSSTAQNPSHTYSAVGTYAVALTATTAVGSNTATKTSYIQVAAAPVAPTVDFSAAPTSGFVPLAVNFTDLSTNGGAPITSRVWSFGDGGSSTTQNPSHTYTTEGVYTVSLTATNSAGSNTTTKTSFIHAAHVPVAPVAAFSGTPTSGDAPLTVQFTDQSTPGSAPITSHLWNFGDASTSTAASPSHVFANPGTYTVSLTVTTPDGADSETKASYVTVAAPPTKPSAAFSGTPTSGFAPLTVNFTDASTNGGSPITSWLWRFGDGATSTSQNPSHVYAAPGTYSVTLRVGNAVGPDSTTKTNYINASLVPLAPTAAFSGTPTAGNAPLTVQFTDESSAGTSPITARSWSFGDGGTSTATNPSHTYSAPGAYDVSLTVTTTVGSDGETKPSYINVSAPPVGPTAAFTGAPTSGIAPLTVNFTDMSTPGTSPILSHLWNFGDGGTSTATNPSHTYNAAGSYTVTLGVATAVGTDSDTKTGYVSVSPAPTAPTSAFTADQTSGFVPLAVNFTDNSTNGGSPITAWSWTFGDGGSSTAQNPAHTYTVAGTYTVTLTTTNAVGSDSLTMAGYITAQVVPVGPTANFNGVPTSGDAPLTVDFSDASSPGTSPITSRGWTFGDGATSSVTNPSHTYSSPGTYSVRLIVVTAVSADTLVKTDYVSVSVPPTAPTADFTADQTDGFVPLTVQFTDSSSSGGQPITSWIWTFGDGGSSSSQNPSHTYLVPGTYDVKLRVANAVGPDSTTKSGYVTARVVPVGPSAEFSGTPTSGDAPLSVTFTDLSDPGTSPITAYAWDFGDGGTSTEANPSHEYTTPGTYTVSLGVTTAVNSSTATKDSYVTVNVPPTLGARTR